MAIKKILIIFFSVFILCGCQKNKIQIQESYPLIETQVIENTESSSIELIEDIESPFMESLTEEESWFDDALFIGDSQTVELLAVRRLGKADYFCKSDLNIFTVLSQTASDDRFQNKTLRFVLSNFKYKKIYIELGNNECGYEHELVIEAYQKIIDLIKELQPDSIIVVQAVVVVSEEKALDKRFSLERITNLNKKIYEMARSNDLYFIDPNEFAADERGYLRTELSEDERYSYELRSTEWNSFIIKKSKEIEDIPESNRPFLEKQEENFSLKWEYRIFEDIMPYMLFSPTKKTDEPIPLIIWLHGSGEKSVGINTFKSRGLPNILINWKFKSFNAYVLCPHLTGEYNLGAWYLEDSRKNLNSLIEKIIELYNIDKTQIIICGHSLGGQGALYMADMNPELYSKVVVFSGYYPNVSMDNIKVPIIGFVGYPNSGEDSSSSSFHYNAFSQKFGKEATTWLNCGHGQVPNMAFLIDNNNNNCSDIIEWMLSAPEV